MEDVDIQVIIKKIPCKTDIEIIPIADTHIGGPDCDMKLLKTTIKYIEETPNCYTILNGDLIDNTIVESVGCVYENEYNPMEQIHEIIDLLKPIAKKILVMTGGNHEYRTKRQTGIDLTAIIALELGIKPVYVEDFWYLYLYFGEKKGQKDKNMVYTLAGYHGSGGGRTSGAKINRLMEIMKTCVADVLIMSHVHDAMATKKIIYIPDYNNKTLTRKEIHFMITNSFLKYTGYAKRGGLSPNSTSPVKLILNAKNRHINMIL